MINFGGAYFLDTTGIIFVLMFVCCGGKNTGEKNPDSVVVFFLSSICYGYVSSSCLS